MKKRVGVWIRVSTKLQQSSDSPEHHLHKAKMYAELKEWDNVDEYHLEAVSVKRVMDNHEGKRMMSENPRGCTEALIFIKISALACTGKKE